MVLIVVVSMLLLFMTVPGIGPAAGVGPLARAATQAPRTVEVVKIFDGDTLLVRWCGETEAGETQTEIEKVRLIGIDAPEFGRGGWPEWGAEEAAQRVKEWLRSRSARLRFDPVNSEREHRDRYHRILAYVEDDSGEDLGYVLIRDGLVRLFRKYRFAREKAYRKAEREARRAGVGLWAGGPQGEFRHLRDSGAPSITVYPSGGDLWAVCVAGQVRLEIAPADLMDVMRKLRITFLNSRRVDLGRVLQEEGFISAGRCTGP